MAGAMSAAGMIVEFVGLPGTGKTSLCRAVALLLRQAGLPVTEPMQVVSGSPHRAVRTLRKLGVVLPEVLRSPRKALAVGRVIATTGQRSRADFLAQWFNWELVTGLQRRCRGRCGIHLFDQGAIQALWSIRFGASRGTLELLAGALPLEGSVPDRVVAVRSGLARIEERLVDRQGAESRIEREHLQLRALWPRIVSLFEENLALVRSLSSRGALELEVFDNGAPGSIEAGAAGLAERLGVRPGMHRRRVEPALRTGTGDRAR